LRREALLVGDPVVRGSRFGRIACLLPFTVPAGTVMVLLTSRKLRSSLRRAMQCVWMPKVRFVPVILEDRVEDQSVTNK